MNDVLKMKLADALLTGCICSFMHFMFCKSLSLIFLSFFHLICKSDLYCLYFPGEEKSIVPPFWRPRPGHTGPRSVQHTEAGVPQTCGPNRRPRRFSGGDHEHGRLCGQLHSNRHQLPAYVNPGKEQPASLWSSTPTRTSAVPSAATTTGAVSFQ